MRLEEALAQSFLVQRETKESPDPAGFIGMADSMARDWRIIEGVRNYVI